MKTAAQKIRAALRKSKGFILAVTAATTLASSPVMAGKLYVGIGVIDKVSDGDTFTVRTEQGEDWRPIKVLAEKKGKGKRLRMNQLDKTFVVRLAGVDTPESVHPNPARNSAEGRAASQYVKKRYDGAIVKFSCWDVGKYGRFICSLEDKVGDIGLDILAQGHSQYVACWGKHPFLHSQYKKAAIMGVRQCRR